MSRLYRMHDANPSGAFPVRDAAEAKHWNERGHGVYVTVNSFRGARQIVNLARINAWAIDIDKGGSKAEQRSRLRDTVRTPHGGLWPSRVVETKRGYQLWWFAKDGQAKHWNAIVLDRLVYRFGADPNARDIARILRMPGYYHLKDPADPFLVRLVYSRNAAYTEREMITKFPAAPKAQSDRRAHSEAVRENAAYRSVDGKGFWDRLYSLDCVYGLKQLSGTPAVNGEQYTFKRTAKGTSNILVNGKGTSCWVDADGRIGSLSNGGPTLYFWLTWFGHSPRDAVRLLKDAFPGLKEDSR